MPDPMIKGSIFGPVAAEIVRLRDEGRLSEEELAAALEAPDLGLLEEKHLEASWYPIPSYARFLDLLCRCEGAGDPAWYEERGAVSARRLMDGGLYSQLDLLGEFDSDRLLQDSACLERALAAYKSKLSLVVSMAGSIYNVGRWRITPDADHEERLCLEIQEAEDYTEGMVLAIQGFLNECAHSVREHLTRLYEVERPGPDLVRFRMQRDFSRLHRP